MRGKMWQEEEGCGKIRHVLFDEGFRSLLGPLLAASCRALLPILKSLCLLWAFLL